MHPKHYADRQSRRPRQSRLGDAIRAVVEVDDDLRR
jgi:hypothetical protein